jgi:PKHD-type hydroxylase
MLTPYSEPIEPWVWWEGAFTSSELDWLQQKAINATEQAQIGGGATGAVNKDIRRSQIQWLDNTPNTKWIFEKLAHVASSLNSQFYRFDLTGFGESLQLTNYDQSEHGMYGWHQDYGGNRAISRKLSMVVQLTDPAQYEGGNLEIMTTGTPHPVQTKGTRQSLVAWISGPAFK